MAKGQRPYYRVKSTDEGVYITLIGARGGIRHVYMDEFVPGSQGVAGMVQAFARGQALVSKRAGKVRQVEAK
jgi:hypothetical protein